MVGIYFSGTGNTKHCLEKLLQLLDPEAETIRLSVSDEKAILERIAANDTVFLAYPTQFSNAPYMVRDFIKRNKNVWEGKKVFCMTTMGLFSGDGTGCSARLLRKYGATIIGGLQVVMPDSIGDSKLLKKPLETNRETVWKADERIEAAARQIRETGKYPLEGLSFFAHLAGLFGQRLWFYRKTSNYSKKLKIGDACVGCGLCTKQCPMGNLTVSNGRAVSADRCAMCYACINTCPKQAITLLGKKVYEQCLFDYYQ